MNDLNTEQLKYKLQYFADNIDKYTNKKLIDELSLILLHAAHDVEIDVEIKVFNGHR